MSTNDHGGHHAPTTFFTKYVFSIDHKIISQQFLFSSLLFVILGGLFALGVRYQIAWPGQNVPYKWLMPGKMTAEAPEANIALWRMGGPVTLSEAMGDVEANNSATLLGFPKGYAVTLPAYTLVQAEDGSQRTLTEEMNAFVSPSLVMADYNYGAQTVRAIPGTKVKTESSATLTITGQELLVPDATGAPATFISKKPVLLPIRTKDTPIKTSAGDTTADKVQFKKDSVTADAYTQLFTMHASIMIFFVIIPTLVGFFGNWAIPLMIGARDMAFPKLNMLSFWLSFPAGLVMLLSFWTLGGPAGGGWTMYPTLSTKAFSAQIGTTLWVVSVGLVGFSSVVGALNYITTIINMRAPGMHMFRMPLTVWSIFITSALALLGTPVLTAAMVLLTFDRHLGTSFFIPNHGGQVILFQHLFWFYSHPAVYIMILPAMGVTSDVLATFSRKPIFGYKPMVFAMAAITGLGFIVWGHHMFQSGMNPVLGTTFMASTIMIAVPSAIKTFNWLGTIWGGNVQFTPAMLNALGFVSMFVIGGLSGIFMASTPIDIQIHDTYFIVAHIHYVLFGGSIFAIFASIYYWFPKLYGVQMNQKWGVIHFIMNIIAFNGTFFLMHILGVGGHPRRYASIMEYPTLLHLQDLNVIMSLWALALGCAQIPFFYNLWVSMPRRLGRAITAFFGVMIVSPMVIGQFFWANADGVMKHTLFHIAFEDGILPNGCIQHIVKMLKPLLSLIFVTTGENPVGYTGFGSFIGSLFLVGALIVLLILMVKQLGLGGKVATIVCLGPICLYAIAVVFRAGSLSSPELAAGATPLDELLYLAHLTFWSPLSKQIAVALGWGVVFGCIVTALVFLMWFVGGMLQIPKILNVVMYAVFLPLWLSPFIFKHDIYLRIGAPGLHDYRWLIAILLGLPGLLYVLIRRPGDKFGYPTDTNPWKANTLEWTISSPPPHENFPEIPTVYRGPYEYSSPVVEEDWLSQVKQLPPGVVEPTGH